MVAGAIRFVQPGPGGNSNPVRIWIILTDVCSDSLDLVPVIPPGLRGAGARGLSRSTLALCARRAVPLHYVGPGNIPSVRRSGVRRPIAQDALIWCRPVDRGENPMLGFLLLLAILLGAVIVVVKGWASLRQVLIVTSCAVVVLALAMLFFVP